MRARGELDWRWEQLGLWCRCGEYMKGDGHDLCPRCEDESAKRFAWARLRANARAAIADAVNADLLWIDGSNICRGQE